MILVITILSIALVGAILFIPIVIKHYEEILELIAYELQGVEGSMTHDNYRLNNVRKLIQKKELR